MNIFQIIKAIRSLVTVAARSVVLFVFRAASTASFYGKGDDILTQDYGKGSSPSRY